MSLSHHTLGDRPVSRFGRFLWSIGPPLVRMVGRACFSLRIELDQELPPPPFVVAANHYSHLDPVVIGASLGGPIRYLAVDELFGMSVVLDRLLAWFGVIPVSRSRAPVGTVRAALARLEAGEAVGVFPEGTRVSVWGDLSPKRGAAWLAVRAGVPLIPVAVVGTDRVFGLDNHWKRAPITVVVGAPIAAAPGDVSEIMARWETWVTERLARFSWTAG